jgi:hypothetical protein
MTGRPFSNQADRTETNRAVGLQVEAHFLALQFRFCQRPSILAMASSVAAVPATSRIDT